MTGMPWPAPGSCSAGTAWTPCIAWADRAHSRTWDETIETLLQEGRVSESS
jgi:hypothetical protein